MSIEQEVNTRMESLENINPALLSYVTHDVLVALKNREPELFCEIFDQVMQSEQTITEAVTDHAYRVRKYDGSLLANTVRYYRRLTGSSLREAVDFVRPIVDDILAQYNEQ